MTGVCLCDRAKILLDIPRFCEQQSQSEGRLAKKTESGHISGDRELLTQFVQRTATLSSIFKGYNHCLIF